VTHNIKEFKRIQELSLEGVAPRYMLKRATYHSNC
jgi:hypothetical protein